MGTYRIGDKDKMDQIRAVLMNMLEQIAEASDVHHWQILTDAQVSTDAYYDT